jgi:hypothetical protein
VCSVSSQGSPVPSAIAAFLFWEVPMMYANPPLRRRLLWKGGDAGPPRLPLLCTPYGKCLAAGPAPSTHSASLVGLGLPLLISLRAIGHLFPLTSEEEFGKHVSRRSSGLCFAAFCSNLRLRSGVARRAPGELEALRCPRDSGLPSVSCSSCPLMRRSCCFCLWTKKGGCQSGPRRSSRRCAV